MIAPISQADGVLKNRPAIVLREMPPYGDLLLCGLSTQVHHEVKGFDEVLSPGDNDYKSSGVTATSLIRLGFLGLAASTNVIGKIGVISPECHKRLLEKLSNYLVMPYVSPK